MSASPVPRFGRAVALLCAAGAALFAAVPGLVVAPPAADFTGDVAWLARWVLSACCGWACLTTTLLVAAALRGPDLLRWCCPRRCRAALLTLAGAAAVTGAATPAHADGWRPPVLARPADHPGPAPHPDRPGRAIEAGPPSPVVVTVRSGDSLWRIATRHRPGADADAIAASVAATYRTNRAVIGPDPDLLHPGQRLQLPDELRDERRPR